MMQITQKIAVVLICVLFSLSGMVPMYWTDFSMSVIVTNRSDEWKRLFLEKGRILEIANVNSSHLQSVIITAGDGWMEIPPGRTVEKKIEAICLNEGLSFPPVGDEVVLTPFSGSQELIAAGANQKAIHSITAFPKENFVLITAKGYSDDEIEGRATDYDEAFQSAVENAARESGFTFTSETILNNLNLIRTQQRIDVEEKSIKLVCVIHEEYNEENGQYLLIGEFEVRSKPSSPQLNN